MPRAAGLAELLLGEFGNDLGGGLTLLPGRKGAFEVTFDGELIFSKHLLDRFPEEGEVEETVARRLGLPVDAELSDGETDLSDGGAAADRRGGD